MPVASTKTKKDIVAINDFNKSELLEILQLAESFRQQPQPQPQLLRGCLMGSCFFEPSTRTRLSFEAAMHRLGGSAIGFTDASTTSTRKGETLYDSMKMMEQYVDVIVLRHPLNGAAQSAAEQVDIPVINAGDGSHQHPTQTLLDLFTIQQCQDRLDGLRIAMVGDLKYGRTVHSLAQACVHFNTRLYFVAPPTLEMPKDVCDFLRKQGVKFSFHHTIEEVIDKTDILYMTRIQAERFSDSMEYERLKGSFVVTPKTLASAKSNLRVLHPFPRVNEIDVALDATPYAYYFQQAKNGLYVRQALLAMVLGKTAN